MIFNAEFLEPSLINENVWARNSTPQIVTTRAEFIPVKPKFNGSNPKGIRNKV